MKIVYKATFVDRLEKQLRYIARDNPSAAKRLKKDIINKIKSIPLNPRLFRKSIYFEDETIRDLIFKGYTIVFRVTKNQVEVFGFVKFQEKPID